MIKKWLFLVLLTAAPFLQAEVITIDKIDDVREYVKDDALYFFDIDETLIDNATALGTNYWRIWARTNIAQSSRTFQVNKTNYNFFDAITLHVGKVLPYTPIEPTTAKLISDLQEDDITVYAYTARGRDQWHSTKIEGADRYAEAQLQYAGIDFSMTPVSEKMQALQPSYFYNGIIFTNGVPKGKMLGKVIDDLGFIPSVIIFVDDKLDQVKSMESAAKELGIPFVGFWYTHAIDRRSDFNPAITNIQMHHLIFQNEVLSDEKATELAKTLGDTNAVADLNQMLEKMKLDEDLLRKLVPVCSLETVQQ